MKAVDEQGEAVVSGATHPDTSCPSGALTPKNLAASELYPGYSVPVPFGCSVLRLLYSW